ncbi:hypothetical protein Tco_0224444 [Tanacetum coccineum]
MIVKKLGSLVQKVILAFSLVILLIPVLTGFTTEGQSSSKPELQSKTSGQISSGLDLTYAPSTITTQKPTEGDLDLLFEATATTTTADSTPTPIIASSQATDLSNTSHDVDELEIQEHVQHQTATIADNVPNAMFDANTFVNPFATLSTSDVESSSSQYVDLLASKY